MKVHLAYGETGMDIDVPAERTVVVSPKQLTPVPDERAAVLSSLRSPTVGRPLRDRVRQGQTVAISMCDGTRPQPRRVMIPAILDELDGIVRADDVVVLVATGTHRGNTPDELVSMLGREVLDRVRVVNHDARDESTLTWCGQVMDVPVWLNREWVDADVRITTGFVEPHFFAGFSGGPKLNAPGLAGLETTLALHNAWRIGDENATWGVTVGNPVHDAVRAIADATGVTFMLDVLLDRDQRIVEVFSGDLLPAHAAACVAGKKLAMAPVPSPFDLVVTTNSGFPLDQNLYQAVKGMSAGAAVIKPGGTLICAAECRDGFPDHGSYREVLASQPSPAALLREIEARATTIPDQWQVQVQARVQEKAHVVMHTATLTEVDLASAHLGYTDDVTASVHEALDRLGPDATLCVLPEGPQTIPYLEGS
ncbi:MAG TPA: nickel-dependent lactate racemase [Acidimicrobiales bacterium]|nr:nickel-dependent lactate racemase [Acidimicrobiales bacterium]